MKKLAYRLAAALGLGSGDPLTTPYIYY
ncbi:cittilin family RiPP precursor [Jatrophihabitans sp.]